jgi:hypothetical protein
VPRYVKAESGGYAAVSSVKNAPARNNYEPEHEEDDDHSEINASTESNEGPVYQNDDSPSVSALHITKAEYQAKKSELKVEGNGTNGSMVRISDADTGTLLGSVLVGSKGKWKLIRKGLSKIPIRIRAESSGNEAVINVKLRN